MCSYHNVEKIFNYLFIKYIDKNKVKLKEVQQYYYLSYYIMY